MNKKVKIVTIIIIVLVVFITSIDIITKGKITGLIGSVNPMNLQSKDVPYTNNSQSTVQGAIDDLYNKANTLNTELTTCQTDLANSVPIDPDTFDTNTTKTVYASSKGVCIKRNDVLNCFKINNWSYEKGHVQQVFSDVDCTVDNAGVFCDADDFTCIIYKPGDVSCIDYLNGDGPHCNVYSNGYVGCN